MNEKQLFTSATKDEHLEFAIYLLKIVETHQQRVVFTGNRWVRNRRRGYQAHFLNDQRSRRHDRMRTFSLTTFAVVLVSVSAATWTLVVNVPVQIGLPMLFFHITALLGVLAFKPYTMRKSQAFSPLQK